ncbi:MAG: hypothetical protein WAU36_04735 [Cyclobacteriaceae bacterium]
MIKKFTRSLWIVALVAFAFACSEDDPLPRSTVDFVNEIAEVGKPVMFDNLSLNADRYEWTFSDGKTSDAISPSITFDEPGEIKVVLKAFTKDNQVDSVVRDITIRQRFLVGYSVNVYPTKDGAADWDPGEADPADAFPDIFVQFSVNKANLTDEEFANSVFDGPFANVNVASFSVDVTDDIILTNASVGWGFALFEFDDNDESITTDDEFTFMAGVGFNPVLSPTIKSEDGESGFITIFSPGDADNPAFGVDLFFELR